MPRRPSHGNDAIQAEAFRKLKPEEFEQLLGELVHAELVDRCTDFELEFPRRYTGGPDARAKLGSAPQVPAQQFQASRGARPLMSDDVGVYTVFSAKSGATGKKEALDEAKDGSRWALDALAAGGRFVLVLAREKADPPTPVRKAERPKKPTSKKALKKLPLKEDLVSRYRARLPETGRVNLEGRIVVVDCNDLRHYICAVRPAISLGLLERLGVPHVPGLEGFDGWDDRHRVDRKPTPDYVEDSARAALGDAIVQALSAATGPSSRALWVVGPPGVGKTRLVIEALRKHRALSRRVRLATETSAAFSALREHEFLASYRDAILVVDDCAEHDLADVYKAFAAKDKERAAALILFTAASRELVSSSVLRELVPIQVDPMNPALSAELIRAEADVEPAQVQAVARLTEGYPWLAVLVARELKDPRTLPPTTVAEAVDLALVGRDAPREARRRGAALLVVMLTEGEALNALDKEDKAALSELFDDLFTGWSDLHATLEQCKNRGLLRRGEGGILRYVTPAIIESEIARRFLVPLPDGPPPLRSRIGTDRMRRRYEKLLRRLEQLGFRESYLAELAEPMVYDIAARPQGIASLGSGSAFELSFAARHLPGPTAAAVRRHVLSTSIDDLRSDHAARRSVVSSLQLLGGRTDSFDDAEEALFRLACAENERFGNNATAVWAELFDLEVNTTYRTFDEKQGLLERRVRAADPLGRRTALAALKAMISEHRAKWSGDEREGPYPCADPAEAQRGRVAAWKLLVERLTDDDGAVASAAADLVAQELRCGVRLGVMRDFASDLARKVPGLGEERIRKLRQAVATANHYDRSLVRSAGAEAAWHELERALEPSSFRDRLRMRLGAWGPPGTRGDEGTDRELAREGLTPPEPIREEIDWLLSSDAARAMPFAIALGFVDEQAKLSEELVRRASSAEGFVSGYFRGHEEAGRGEVVDAAIAKLREDLSAGDAAAVVIWRARATPTRLVWLVEDLRARRVSDRVIAAYLIGAWERDLSVDELERFVEALLEIDTDAAAATALDSVVRRLSDVPDLSVRLAPLLERAFRRASRVEPSGHFAYEWGLAAKALIRAGDAAEVAETIVNFGTTDRGSLFRDEILEALRDAAAADPAGTWRAIEPSLSTHRAERLAFSVRAAGITPTLPAGAIEAWVGRDRDRARILAHMIPMHRGSDLSELARLLIGRFGPESDAGGILASAVQSTPGAVSSLAAFATKQLARTEVWAQDENPRVRKFAEKLASTLRRSRDVYAASEEYERRRFAG